MFLIVDIALTCLGVPHACVCVKHNRIHIHGVEPNSVPRSGMCDAVDID